MPTRPATCPTVSTATGWRWQPVGIKRRARMPDYVLYHLAVTTLTPLHIGSGVTLLHEYDYAIQGGRTWRIDDAGFLDAQHTDDPAFIDQLAATPPARLLNPGDYQPGSPFFRYVIKGAPRSQAEGAQIQEQLK